VSASNLCRARAGYWQALARFRLERLRLVMHKAGMKQTVPQTRGDALARDRSDPLAAIRAAFRLPGGVTYLVGHSLGPATHRAVERVIAAAADEWAGDLVGAWNSAGWIDLAEQVGGRIAGLIGAESDEVIVCDSVSVNLFKLAAAALGKERRIIVEDDEFPTDQYVSKGLSDLSGADFVRTGADGGIEALAKGGVLVKSLVNYRSAQIADIAAHEAAAAASGGTVVWDLSHATGVIHVDVAGSGMRLATGCTYKYLNGGPGAPSFIYARRDLLNSLHNPLPGWMGHARPFAFESDYEPRNGTMRFASGTPGILSLSALAGALEAFDGVDMQTVEAKALALGDMCLSRLAQMKLETRSPAISSARGGHVSWCHPEGYAIVRALAAEGIMADFRTPDTIRFGLSPLFLSYADVWDALDRLEAILATAAWDRAEFKVRAKVT
jgi:kynureninase